MGKKNAKFIVACLLAICMLSSIASINAEEIMPSMGVDDMYVQSEPIKEDWDQGTRSIYRTITIIHENDPVDPDDDVTVYIMPAVAEITYAVCGVWSTWSQSYAGAYADASEEMPAYTAYADSTIGYPLDVSFGAVNYPSITRGTGRGDQYEVYMGGGTYQLSYNKVLKYDMSGALIETQRVTDTLAHYFTYTGSEPYI